jgi:hypothetical protein
MSRAYLRVDPAMFERKVIQQEYPPLAYAAYSAILCLADSQPVRGRFRDERLLRALLGPLGRQVPYLLSRRDIIPATEHAECVNCPVGHGSPSQLYVDGWDEWQEGDWQVKERMARVRGRNRNNGNGADRKSDRNQTVLAGRGEAVDEAVQTHRYTGDVRKAFHHVTGRLPDEDEMRWLEELCRDLGREHVVDALYADPTPTKRGILGRISRKLRGTAA